MLNVNDYYARVKAKACELDPSLGPLNAEDDRRSSPVVVWLMSQSSDFGSKAGQCVEANVNNAAEWLVKGTHRLATEAEIKAEVERREQLAIAIRKQDQEARGRALPPEIQSLAAIAATMIAAQGQPQGGRKGN